MYYVGVDVGGTNLVAGLMNENCEILDKASHPVDHSQTPEQLCGEIVRLAKQVCQSGGVTEKEVRAVGIGLPGQVNNKTGIVVRTPNMPFQNTPVRQLFQRQWDMPVFLGNDADCAAIGEYRSGSAKGCSPAVTVTLGTGIGAGMVVDGKLFTGFAGSGMEVGHMIIHPNGHLCGCGNRGCWEQYGSASALIQMTLREMERSQDSLLWQLCEGDKSKVQGRTVFQAARICMGGGVSNADDDLLLDPVRELVRQGSFDKTMPTRLVRASLGNDAGVVGAAMLCDSI